MLNWFVPAQSSLAGGHARLQRQRHPAAEFGSEAARTAWRLGWLWYGDARAAALTTPLAAHAGAALGSYGLNGCYNLAGSGAAALARVPRHVDPQRLDLQRLHAGAGRDGGDGCRRAPSLPLTTQQRAVDNAATLLGSKAISDYYSGSWVAIATLTLSGDLSRLAPVVLRLGGATNQTFTSAPPAPSPVPSPPSLPASPPPCPRHRCRPRPASAAGESCARRLLPAGVWLPWVVQPVVVLPSRRRRPRHRLP